MVVITERWVQDKVGLEHNQLHNVRSLFLPGSRVERVSYLGASLHNFGRLKNLDLSCNELVSLEGLHSLGALEKLNLYYNRISDLTELFRLRHNKHLREIDIRLNPVASQDPQYRLFLVKLLPKIKRLDDMPILDSERAASVNVFTTDQLEQFGITVSPSQKSEIHKTLSQDGEQNTGRALPDLADDVLERLLVDDTPLCGSWVHKAAFLERTPHVSKDEPDLRYFNDTHHGDLVHTTADIPRPSLQPKLGGHVVELRVADATESSSSTSIAEELVLEAAKAILSVLKDFNSPGFLPSFTCQDRIIRSLNCILVQPLLEGMSSTVQIVQDELNASTARVQTLEKSVNGYEESAHLLKSLIPAHSFSNDSSFGTVYEQLERHIRTLEESHKGSEKRVQTLCKENSHLQGRIEKLEADLAEEFAKTASLREEILTSQSNEPTRDQSATQDIGDLVCMLRDSHVSLSVASRQATETLETERAKHEAEIAQLRWNYEELKKSADLLLSS